MNFRGVLSDRDIKREIKEGKIILHNPEECDQEKNIQNCSVDITLGKYYYRNVNRINYYNPYNSEHVHKYWGNNIEASVIGEKDINSGLAGEMGLKLGDKYILLNPNESILGHSQEFIGSNCNHITTMLKARSSMGRSNITICRDAGWGDIGYFNRWTLEITNNSTAKIILPVGSRIGQIVFLYTGECDKKYNGKYQKSTDNLQKLINDWKPELLLPKLDIE